MSDLVGLLKLSRGVPTEGVFATQPKWRCKTPFVGTLHKRVVKRRRTKRKRGGEAQRRRMEEEEEEEEEEDKGGGG